MAKRRFECSQFLKIVHQGHMAPTGVTPLRAAILGRMDRLQIEVIVLSQWREETLNFVGRFLRYLRRGALLTT
jgi:hypothetical protein